MSASIDDIFRGIKDLCREENLDYSIFPTYIEIYHPKGGARLNRDGTIKSAGNAKLEIAIKRRILAVEAKSGGNMDAPELAYVHVLESLDVLTDAELSNLKRIITEKQFERDTERQVSLSGH